MRSAHHLHGVLDMTPLLGLFRVALAFTSQRIAGRLGDGSDAMLLEHLPRDGVDLRLGCHLALPVFPQSEPRERFFLVLRLPLKPLNRRSRSTGNTQVPAAPSPAAPTSPSLRLALVKPGRTLGPG